MLTTAQMRQYTQRTILMVVVGTALTACQVVSIKRQTLDVSIANERNSILTQDKLSSASLNVLSMTGRESEVCIDNPDQCVNDLKALPQIIDEQYLSTASEMYLAKAMQLEKTSACKTSSAAEKSNMTGSHNNSTSTTASPITNSSNTANNSPVFAQPEVTAKSTANEAANNANGLANTSANTASNAASTPKTIAPDQQHAATDSRTLPAHDATANNQQDCLDQQLSMLDKSIRYSYAYLFQSRRQPQARIFDNRQVQIRDFYNQAIAKLVTTYNFRHQPSQLDQNIQIGHSRYQINLTAFPELKNQKIEQLASSYDLNFSGLKSMNRRDGFGSEFVAVFPKPKNDNNSKYILNPLDFKYPDGANPNIHQSRYLATTIVAQPVQDAAVDDVLSDAAFELKLFDPYKLDQVSIAEQSYPLAANFSAPYGMWLAQNNLGLSAYLTLIDRDTHLTMPHLYLLEPYNPNKKIIVLIHGLASSPEAWIGVTNDIMGDPILREKYQVWQIFYSTNMPILESRYQIYAILTQAFQKVNASDSANHDVVVIGHSMGGIISRLLVSQEKIAPATMRLLTARQRAQLTQEKLLLERLNVKPIPQFSRAIFVSAPHRGTEYAELWFTRFARKVIKVPGAFLGAIAESVTTLNANPADLLQSFQQGFIQNGPSDLSSKSKFMTLTKNVMPPSGFKYHSIMGNKTNSNDPNVMTDGIVPYKSSHLAGALSERVFKGGHSIQEKPEAVLELRRILRLHLAELGLDPAPARSDIVTK